MKKLIMIVLLSSTAFAICPSYTAGTIQANYCLKTEANKLQAKANSLKREEIKELKTQNNILRDIVRVLKNKKVKEFDGRI